MLPSKKNKLKVEQEQQNLSEEFKAPQPRGSSAKRKSEHMSIKSGDSLTPSPDLQFRAMGKTTSTPGSDKRSFHLEGGHSESDQVSSSEAADFSISRYLFEKDKNRSRAGNNTQESKLPHVSRVKGQSSVTSNFGLKSDSTDINHQLLNQLSMPEVWENLTRVYRNEKVAPQLLEYQLLLVEQAKRILQLKQGEPKMMDKELENVEKDRDRNLIIEKKETVKEIHQLDAMNGLYLIKSYLRTRIEKIRKNWIYLMTQSNKEGLLAPHERDFLTNLFNMRVTALNEQFLKHLPQQLNPFISTKKYQKIAKIEEPDFDKKVLVEIIDITPLQDSVEGITMYDLVKFRKKGDIFYSRYKLVRPLILHKKVALL